MLLDWLHWAANCSYCFRTLRFGYDVNANVVNKINSGQCHIIEPGLDELVNAKVGNNYLKADTNINISDVYIIAVPTPFIKETAEIPKPI